MSLREELQRLQREIARLRVLVDNTDVPVSLVSITRDDMTPAVNAALIALMPGSALTEWGLKSMYSGDAKMNDFGDIRTFEPNRVQTLPPVFCGGPGALVDKRGKDGSGEFREPVWGTAGLFPHLVAIDTAFFNAQASRRSQDYMPLFVAGMQRSEGRAILVFYPHPWSSYLEAAMLVYFISRGSPYIYALCPANLEAAAMLSPDEGASRNIPGTTFNTCTQRDRHTEVAVIVTALLRQYGNSFKDAVPRVYASMHAAPGPEQWTLLDDIRRNASGTDRNGTLAQALLAPLFATQAAVPATRLERWRVDILKDAKTDIGVCLHLVFLLNAKTDWHATVSRVQGLILVFAETHKASPKSIHLKELFPVMMFLNLMLPVEIQVPLAE